MKHRILTGAFFAAFALALLVAPAHAAITGTGGTETFAGLTPADAALLNMPTDLTGWTTLYGTNTAGVRQVNYDTSAGGGTLDTAAYVAGTGGQVPPERTADIHMYSGVQYTGSKFAALYSPIIGDVPLNATTVWTYYIAQHGFAPGGTLAQSGKYYTVGVIFPEASNVRKSISFALLPTNPTTASGPGSSVGGDLRVYSGNLSTDYAISTGSLGNNVGAGAADLSDYLMDQWNRVDIEITLTAADTGTAVLKYNGATIQSVALTDTANLRKQQFLASMGSNVTGDATTYGTYIDDVSVRLLPAAAQATMTESFNTTLGAGTFGARSLDDSTALNETIKRPAGMTLAWGGYVAGGLTPASDNQIYVDTASVGAISIKGTAFQAGTRAYTRLDTTSTTFVSPAGATVPSAAVNCTAPGTKAQLIIRQQPITEALAFAVLIRDPSNWYQSSAKTVAGPVTSGSPATLDFDFSGGSAVTWTRVDTYSGGGLDMDQADNGGELTLAYSGTVGAATPNFASIEGMGFVIPTTPVTALVNTNSFQVGEISLVVPALGPPNAASGWVKFF